MCYVDNWIENHVCFHIEGHLKGVFNDNFSTKSVLVREIKRRFNSFMLLIILNFIRKRVCSI